MSGPCEIHPCADPAVGHCGSCNRSFCRSHQALDADYFGVKQLSDQCHPCRAEQIRMRAEAYERDRVNLAEWAVGGAVERRRPLARWGANDWWRQRRGAF